jgi:hypothetical protein
MGQVLGGALFVTSFGDFGGDDGLSAGRGDEAGGGPGGEADAADIRDGIDADGQTQFGNGQNQRLQTVGDLVVSRGRGQVVAGAEKDDGVAVLLQQGQEAAVGGCAVLGAEQGHFDA